MAYRDSHRVCPVCGVAFESMRVGPRRFDRCKQCGGIWLDWATLVSMWTQMSPYAGQPELTPRRPGVGARERSCPSCQNMMERLSLREVPLDRCQAHGVWFDRGELEVSLAAALMGQEEWFRAFMGELLQMS